MNFLNIEYFLVAAKELNFTKAAEKLYISPQSLSTHIAKLESELGTELFFRDHPMRLTYAGEILVKRGQDILDRRNQTLDELRDVTDSKKGKLNIGISHTRGKVFLPMCLPKFHEEYPGVRLQISEAATSKLDNAIANGEIDLMISLLPFSDSNLEAVELCREEILMLVPNEIVDKYLNGNTNLLNRITEEGDLSPIKDCPFIMMHTENRVRVLADKIFSDCGIKPNILLEVENIETLLELCKKGMGITFYPHSLQTYSSSEEFKGLNVIKLPFENANSAIGIGYMKNRFLPSAAKEFIRIMKEAIN